MPYVHNNFLDALANHAATIPDKIALIDETDGGALVDEITTVHWKTPADGEDTGTIRPYANAGFNENLVFSVTAGETVTAWRARLTDDSELFGGNLTSESYASDGEFTLIGDQTGLIIELKE